MNYQALQLDILGPAFAVGLLVLATHVPLGMQVLTRGIVFIDLAIAQIAGLGVIVAQVLGLGGHAWAVQLAAMAAALGGGLVLTFTEKRWPDVQEALIGVSFVLAATGGLLLLSHDPHGGEHMRDLLAGQILWIGYAQLLPALLASALILLVWFGMGKNPGRMGFYLLFACAVTMSVQLVGVYLVFASLIVPALALRREQSVSRRFAISYGIGAAGYLMGLVLSALFDLPASAVIVWIMTVFALFYALILKACARRFSY